MKRHVGRMKNTDARLVVVFMQIPGRKSHALVVPTEGLPGRYEQNLMALVESNEGQSSENLADVLGRRFLPDSNTPFLQSLHENGLLQAVPIDNVVMFPLPNQPYPLRAILQAMGRQVPEPGVPPTPSFEQALSQLNEGVVAEPAFDPTTLGAPAEIPVEKFNPHLNNQQASVTEENIGIASNLLAEAADLEAIARGKREQAYRFAPSLRPQPEAPARVTAAAATPKASTKAKTVEVTEKKAPARRAAPKRKAN